VDDQSVITVVDSAVAPTTRASPRRAAMAFLGLVLGAIAALAVTFGGEYMRHVGGPRTVRDLVGALRRGAADVSGARRTG
jgi:hypothetical protein